MHHTSPKLVNKYFKGNHRINSLGRSLAANGTVEKTIEKGPCNRRFYMIGVE
jgi:hypothetical protein